MEEKERYEIHRYTLQGNEKISFNDYTEHICENYDFNFKKIKPFNKRIQDLLNQQDTRIEELEEENQQLKDQVKKAYQEGLLQKQFDKDMEIQELKDQIELLTTIKKIINEHSPAFCKLAGRDCEWLGKEKQLAIEELEKVKEYIVLNDKYDEEVGCNIIETFDLLEGLTDKIKSLKGEK